MTANPPIADFPCQCTWEEVSQARDATDLEWTRDFPAYLLEWRPLGDDQPLWPATLARQVCTRVLGARKLRDFTVEKRALRVRPDIQVGWGKRKRDEAHVDYIRRNLIKACVRWIRATDPKHARRAERDRRADRTLFGSRRADLFSAEAKKDIIRPSTRDRHRRP